MFGCGLARLKKITCPNYHDKNIANWRLELLSELKVKSLGIIDGLDWFPRAGLNVITGETGAGKSLVAFAIRALVDGRLDETSIRHGAGLASIEGVFRYAQGDLPALEGFLADRGVPLDEDGLVMSGEFRQQGRAVFRLNGSAVPRAIVRDAGRLLVDVHSQSEHLALFERRNHIDYLDLYGDTTHARERFAQLAGELSRLSGELITLEQAQQDLFHRKEMLSYQADEIRRADLGQDEEEALLRERQVLASSEKLKALAYEASQALTGDEGAALSRLYQAGEAMRRLAAIDSSLTGSAVILDDAYINVQELAREVQVYGERLEFDPRRLEEIDGRLEIMRNLKKKYGGTITAVLDYLSQTEQELSDITSGGANRVALEGRISEVTREMGLVGDGLSQARTQAARRLAAAVQTELGELGLGQVSFEVSLTRQEDPGGIPLLDRVYAFDRTGIDKIEFVASTNPGEPLRPLADIASTGEMSRFTLAIKVALAEADRTPVLVFDEIDIGIGGRSGEVMGQKLWRLARHHQVVCITHLPQIAAYGDVHCMVQKNADGERTTTSLREITDTARLDELAVMIGGTESVGPVAETAAALLERARQWIDGQR